MFWDDDKSIIDDLLGLPICEEKLDMDIYYTICSAYESTIHNSKI